MQLTIELDTTKLADAINEIAGEEVETAATIERWLDDNASELPTVLLDALAEHVAEGYVS